MNKIQQDNLSRILHALAGSEDEVVSLQTMLTSLQAMPPEHGGDGENAKANWLAGYLAKELGIKDLLSIKANDSRVSSGYRPNLVAKIQGKRAQTLWIFCHLDVVSPGDLGAWDSDPWTVRREGDLLYGRGVEDNQQAIVSTLLLARALQKERIVPEVSLGMVFMADEECGSRFGLCHILKERQDLFKDKDSFLVPDFGHPLGSRIEIAEKAVLWLKITVKGVQGHASTPEKTQNAFVAGARIAVALHDILPGRFTKRHPLFSPKTSTFVPSQPECASGGINIVPGSFTFHLDCRLLPGVDDEMVIAAVHAICDEMTKNSSITTEISVIQRQKASAVDPESPVIAALQKAVSSVYPQSPQPVGVGGGTVAAHLREKGFPALVWATLDNTCHTPNEYSSISNTINDSCVFAHLLFEFYV